LFIFLQVIDFELPITVQLTVVDVDPGLKGDTAQGNVIWLLKGKLETNYSLGTNASLIYHPVEIESSSFVIVCLSFPWLHV
jgi:hypothetical protein